MFQFRVNTVRMVSLLFVAMVAATFSCDLIDLRPVAVSTMPASAYTMLASRESCVVVTFSAEPERLEAERAFLVRSPEGAVEGDFSWNGPGFTWKPVSPWNPGLRYRLILKGSIRTLDGREVRPEIDLPFFAQRSTGQPLLSSFTPAQGSSIGVSTGSLPVLKLEFTEAMEVLSTETAFNLKPAAECCFSWNTEQTILYITPKEKLSVCSMYRWTLGTGARAVDGTPLGRSAGGTFITNLDSTPPRVERAYPVFHSGGAWVEAAADLSGLDARHSLAVLFSEPIEPVSAIGGIRLEPSQTGRSDAVGPRLVVFTPEREWLPEQALTLVVSADVKDSSGLRAGEEFRLRFTPLVPYLKILAVSAGVDKTTDDLGDSSILTVALGDAPDGICTLMLRFSAPFDAATKVATAERVTLSAFFPSYLPAPSLRDLCWLSDDTLTMTWEGLRANDDEAINFYRLLVPGGQGGILSGKGLWLKDDGLLYLEVEN